MRASLAAAAAALAAAAGAASGKVLEETVTLSSVESEVRLAKFSFSSGAEGVIRGDWSVEGDTAPWRRGPHDLRVYLYSDVQWEKFTKMMAAGSLCRERVQVASSSFKLDSKIEQRGGTFDYTLPSNRARSHYWYALMSDCELEWYDARNLSPLKLHLTFLNGGSHLPADEAGLFGLHAIVLAGMGAAGALLAAKGARQVREQEVVHVILLAIAAAYALQMMSLGCELAHLATYARDGKGLRFRHTLVAADFFSEMLENVSELLTAFLLIFLACGWTTLTVGGLAETLAEASGAAALPVVGGGDGAKALNKGWREFLETRADLKLALAGASKKLRRPAAMLGSLNAGSALVASVALMHVVLTVLGRQYEDGEDFTQFHDHEHWPGYCLVALRLFLWVVFLGGGWAARSAAKGDPAVSTFLAQLRVLGSAWMLAFPACVFLAGLAPPYSRHAIVSTGALSLQATALVGLALLVTSKHFRDMSTLAAPLALGGAGAYADAASAEDGTAGLDNGGKGMRPNRRRKVAVD